MPAQSGGRSTRRPLWRNRNFLLLFSGQIVSSMGSQVSLLAFPLLVLSLTHSAAEAGILGAARSAPFIVFTLPAGALLDRWDRKRVMILADAGRALALGSIPLALLTGRLSLVQLVVVSLIEGTLFTFFNVAESASLPQVVPREQVPDAVGLNQTVDSLSLMTGPSLSGILYSAAPALPFLADAISYTGSVLSLLFISTRFQQERTPASTGLREEIGAGLRWMWGHPVLRSLALMLSVLNLFSMGYPLIMIVRAQELHATPAQIGLLFGTGGIGSILGSLLVGPLQRRVRFGRLIAWGAWVWTITWIPYAVAPNLILFGIANVVGWIIVPIVMGTQFSYRLIVIPDAFQARVGSVFKLLAFGVEPLALALTGVLLQGVGPVTTVWIVLVPQALVSVLILFDRPLGAVPKLGNVPHGEQTAD